MEVTPWTVYSSTRQVTVARTKICSVDELAAPSPIIVKLNIHLYTACCPFVFNCRHTKVRAISHPRPVTVLFYCLDPEYPGLPHVAALDVEGFLTNSESTRQYLLPSAPTAFVPLAVDTETFPFYPDPSCRAPGHCAATRGGDDDDALARDRDGGGYSSGRVVYVGAAGLMEYKGMLAWMLREAAPYGLDIYGSGWQQYPEFLGYWRGVLPQGDLVSCLKLLGAGYGTPPVARLP